MRRIYILAAFLTLSGFILVVARTFAAAPATAPAIAPETATSSGAVGRYQLGQFKYSSNFRNENNNRVYDETTVLMKLDTATGKTWVYDGSWHEDRDAQ